MSGIMRLLCAALLLSGAVARADVTVVWTPANDGKGMEYEVIAAQPPSFWDPNTRKDCGALWQSPQCVVVTGTLGGWWEETAVPIKGKQTPQAILAAWMQLKPRGYISDWYLLSDPKRCLIFELRNRGTFANSCVGTVNPPPEPPTPPASCYLSGNIYLQHGPVADGEVNSSKANAVVRIYCTKATRVKVRALSSVGSGSAMVNLRADGSLKTMLTVEGYVGNGGVQLDVPGTGGRDVIFSSQLLAGGIPAPGDFSGSAVAVVDIL